ncbi:MAG: DUF1836 domain-containing protein [Christensenellaceae bacterium]
MIGNLPGTTIEVDLSKKDAAQRFLDPLFLTNGLVLSQVTSLTAIEKHTIQNWVKRGFISPPIQKKYGRIQFLRLALINLLKDVLQIEKIIKMLDHIEELGQVQDMEYVVYVCLTQLLGTVPQDVIGEATKLDELINNIISEQKIMDKNTEIRLNRVLKTMYLANLCSTIKKQAELMIDEFDF